MPIHDEDGPRPAEIFRNLTDFRNEFRSAIADLRSGLADMVRKDVYSAHMASMQLQIDSLGRENRRLGEEMEKDRADRVNDRRSLRNVTVGAVLTAIVAIVVLILEVLVK